MSTTRLSRFSYSYYKFT